MYTVVIIDDEPWALQGLAEIIDWSRDGFSIIGQFTDPDEAFEFLREKEPDVVFTDIRMPGLSGLDLIDLLMSRCVTTLFRSLVTHRWSFRIGSHRDV